MKGSPRRPSVGAHVKREAPSSREAPLPASGELSRSIPGAAHTEHDAPPLLQSGPGTEQATPLLAPPQSANARRLSSSGGRRTSRIITTEKKDKKEMKATRRQRKTERKAAKAKDPEKAAEKATKKAQDPNHRQKRWVKLFGRLDTSGDALLDKVEFMTAANLWVDTCPRIPDVFKLDFMDWDADGDGTICEGEFFTFCEALWTVVGERAFVSLEEVLKCTTKASIAKRKKAKDAALSANATAAASSSSSSSSSSSDSEAEDAELLAQAVKSKGDTASQHKPPAEPVAGGHGHEATLNLEAAIKTATDSGCRKTLRKAINDARVSGVDRNKVEEAVDLVRRIEVQEVLDRAMVTNNPMILRVAILNIRTMGAEQETLDKAQELCAVLEIREKLEQALKHNDEEDMKVHLAKAVEVGMPESEVEVYNEKMKQVEIFNALDKAIRHKDTEALAAQLKRAEDEGMEGLAKFKEATEFLPKLEAQGDAHKVLSKAVCSGNLQDLKEAIEVAQACGLEDREIRRAQRILTKAEAREALGKAITTEKRGELVHALHLAKQADLNIPEIAEAESILTKLDVNLELSMATDSCNVQELQNAVKKGRMSGIALGKLEQAELLILELQTAEAEGISHHKSADQVVHKRSERWLEDDSDDGLDNYD